MGKTYRSATAAATAPSVPVPVRHRSTVRPANGEAYDLYSDRRAQDPAAASYRAG